MIISIFGATGLVGKQLVKYALHKEYTVRAFGRNVFTAGFDEHEQLQLIPGALFDEAQVLNAIKGTDAVLSVPGSTFNSSDKTRSLGMKNIIAQMQKTSVKRIIAVGDIGILNATDDELIIDSPGYPPKLLDLGKEHYKAYQYLQASSLSWTFVCPPDIVDADITGSYHTAANYPPVPNNGKINAGDLALFMLNELIKNEYIKQRVGISN